MYVSKSSDFWVCPQILNSHSIRPVVPNLFYAVAHLSLSAERRGPPPQNNKKRYSVFI